MLLELVLDKSQMFLFTLTLVACYSSLPHSLCSYPLQDLYVAEASLLKEHLALALSLHGL